MPEDAAVRDLELQLALQGELYMEYALTGEEEFLHEARAKTDQILEEAASLEVQLAGEPELASTDPNAGRPAPPGCSQGIAAGLNRKWRIQRSSLPTPGGRPGRRSPNERRHRSPLHLSLGPTLMPRALGPARRGPSWR